CRNDVAAWIRRETDVVSVMRMSMAAGPSGQGLGPAAGTRAGGGSRQSTRPGAGRVPTRGHEDCMSRLNPEYGGRRLRQASQLGYSRRATHRGVEWLRYRTAGLVPEAPSPSPAG